jgi:hypothetical protein
MPPGFVHGVQALFGLLPASAPSYPCAAECPPGPEAFPYRVGGNAVDEFIKTVEEHPFLAIVFLLAIASIIAGALAVYRDMKSR